MKKIFSLLCICFFLLSTRQSKAQYIHLIQHTDSCAFQHFLVYTGTSGASGAPFKIALFYGDGTSDTLLKGTGSTNPEYTLFKHNYAVSGVYSIKALLLDASLKKIAERNISINYKGCTYIIGNIYLDKNANCNFDIADDTLYSFGNIKVDSNGVTIDTISYLNNFIYRLEGFKPATYTFTPIKYASGLSLSCPTSGKLTCTSVLGKGVKAGDFGFSCSASSGIDVSINPISRAGRHTMFISSTLSSNSCTKASGTFSMTVDARYPIFYKTYPAGGVVSGQTVTWNYSDLSLILPQYFIVYCESPIWLTAGTIVTNTVSATYFSDIDTSNNIAILNDTVKLSFDPNEKKVSPSGFIAPGTTLNYTLSFENTGNAPAQNIHILDTLDNNLDASSIQFITSSHKMNLYKSEVPATGKTVLKFDFPNINLKDSSHKGECEGFVIFSVKTKTGLTKGTYIPNRVGIYFDDNEVVLTNTVSNQINMLDIPRQSKLSNVLIYPNPTGDLFVVKAPLGSFEKLEVINCYGQTLIHKACEGAETQVNIAALAPGIYYMLLKSTNGTRIEKIEKK